MTVTPGDTQQRMPEASSGASPNARFLAGGVLAMDTPKVRLGNAMSVSLVSHVVGFFFILFVLSYAPDATVAPPQTNEIPKEIVWLTQPGPGGGGGGGGNRSPEPPRKAELPGLAKITVPVAKPPKLSQPEPPKDVPKEPPLTIPAQPMASAVDVLPGAISAAPAIPTASLGSGTGGGAGTGSGSGVGSGQGSGFGPGSGGGTGGGVYQPGNGVTPPKLIHEVKPTYTGEAMRAKIQGLVTMEAVVLPDGSVGPVRVTRSLDDRFGLDQEAVKTVKRWRFAPGMRLGQPVPVLVEIEMQFTLR